MDTARRRWTRLKPDERRAQILGSARRLFAERHYGAVSTGDIAREAGVARGLLYHYFGTRHQLYLEVVRSMLRLPAHPVPGDLAGRDLEEVLAEAVDGWLIMVQRNRATWLAAVGAQGLGRDPEVEAVMEEMREEAAARAIAVLTGGKPEKASPALSALIRAYAGFVEAVGVEWLTRSRLSRAQAHALLVHGLLQLLREVLPRVERAGRPTAEEKVHLTRARRRPA